MRFFSIALIAMAMTGGNRPAQATSLEMWDTPKLAKESKWIRRGEVTSMWSSWDPQQRMVYTYVKMRVDETIKGDPHDETLIRVPGGRAGGVGMTVHGVANFSRGERAIVFLKQDQDGAPSLVGMTQGKYSIVRGATGQDMAVFRAPANVEFFTRGERGQVRHLVSSPVERKIPVQDLIREIRSAVNSQGVVAH